MTKQRNKSKGTGGGKAGGGSQAGSKLHSYGKKPGMTKASGGRKFGGPA